MRIEIIKKNTRENIHLTTSEQKKIIIHPCYICILRNASVFIKHKKVKVKY